VGKKKGQPRGDEGKTFIDGMNMKNSRRVVGERECRKDPGMRRMISPTSQQPGIFLKKTDRYNGGGRKYYTGE